jgi:hypothetical protein
MTAIKNEFPLYSHLKNEIEKLDEPLSQTEKSVLVEKIKDIDDQGCTLIYALIRYYQIYEEKADAMSVPYGMKKMKTGYRFCIEDLPPLLQHLLKRFVDIHLESNTYS